MIQTSAEGAALSSRGRKAVDQTLERTRGPKGRYFLARELEFSVDDPRPYAAATQ